MQKFFIYLVVFVVVVVVVVVVYYCVCCCALFIDAICSWRVCEATQREQQNKTEWRKKLSDTCVWNFETMRSMGDWERGGNGRKGGGVKD